MVEKLKTWAKKYFKSLNLWFYVGMIVLSIALLVFDIVTKHWAYQHFAGRTGVLEENAIPGLIDFTLVFNNGAAWNFLADQKWILVTISLVASLVLLFFLLCRADKYNKVIMVGIALMFSGALGNLIDRFGYMLNAGIYSQGVIDFLAFHFIPNFPVCNIADYCLSVGVVVLIVGVIIAYVKQDKKAKETLAEVQAEDQSQEKQEDMLNKLSAIEKKKQENNASEAVEAAKEDTKSDETDVHN